MEQENFISSVMSTWDFLSSYPLQSAFFGLGAFVSLEEPVGLAESLSSFIFPN